MLHAAFFRFGLGPSPSEQSAPPRDPRAWVDAQLDRPPLRIAEAGLLSTLDGLEQMVARRAAMQSRPGQPATPGAMEAPGPQPAFNAELAERLRLAVESRLPLHERLALHWMNHFTVSIAAGQVIWFAGAMEREAIRPHMLGRFEDMLAAVTTHPAMLFYLNNNNSVGPGSPAGQRLRRGLNENLARELLELHTLGVDGGYSQADVVELAKVLTGWAVRFGNPNMSSEDRLAFVPGIHEPGPKTVLGRRYAEDGPGQLKAVLQDLAAHPATARNVSRRMVRHFLGGTAPDSVQAAMERAFRDSGGDLKAMTRAMLRHPAAWEMAPAKLRPPIELVFSAARVLGGLPDRPPVRRALMAMGQPWTNAPSPAGWPEEDDAWGAPDAVKTRLDWSLELSARLGSPVDARALAEAVFRDRLSAETRRAIQRAASGGQALTLFLMSPEFQRR